MLVLFTWMDRIDRIKRRNKTLIDEDSATFAVGFLPLSV
jgi:hypothetical protein